MGYKMSVDSLGYISASGVKMNRTFGHMNMSEMLVTLYWFLVYRTFVWKHYCTHNCAVIPSIGTAMMISYGTRPVHLCLCRITAIPVFSITTLLLVPHFLNIFSHQAITLLNGVSNTGVMETVWGLLLIPGLIVWFQVFRKPWPGIMRGIYQNQERFQNTYFKKFPGFYVTGDGKCS